MSEFNVLSLFDGISNGQIALNRAGIKYDNYFASEVDKHAIKVTQSNYPKTIQLGSVVDVKAENLPKIELLIGGFCCQSFSFAGKQLNFNDPRGKLFFEYVRILKECKPKYFLAENVRMKKEYQDIISGYLGVEPILINSSKLSAQNRERNYWTNIPNVTQPEDKGIMLKDVIKEDYDGIWVWPRGANKGGIKSYKGKSPSVTISSRQHNFLIYNGSKSKTGLKIEGYIDNNSQGNRVYSINGKSPCLNATSGGTSGNGNSLILVKDKVRKFTPEEAEALQTVPKYYTKYVKDVRFLCIYYGIKHNICLKNAKLKIANAIKLISQQDSVTNIILDTLEPAQPIDSSLTKQRNVITRDATGADIQRLDTVYYIINDLSDMERQSFLKLKDGVKKNVCIAIERLSQAEACAINTIKHGGGMETLHSWIRKEKIDIIKLTDLDITFQLMERDGTHKSWRISWEEKWNETNAFIISTLIKLIIQLKIYTYVKIGANIQAYINNLELSEQNYIGVGLSGLRMENIILNSNNSRFKQLGNGWTVDVIVHILKNI